MLYVSKSHDMKITTSSHIRSFFHTTPDGNIIIVESKNSISRLFFIPSNQPIDAEWEETPLLQQTALQLNEYFTGKRRIFNIPFLLQGSEFELTVWKALLTIPYGKTRTYGEIARQIGRPTASRAVGQAIHKNPIHIIIPCHRVIGAQGKLTGYAAGTNIKQRLLQREAFYCKSSDFSNV